MGALAILDIAQISKNRSGNHAQHFTAVAFGARTRVGHHTARCADYGDAKSVKHRGQLVLAKVGATAGPAVAFHLFNHAATFHVLEVDAQLAPDLAVFQRKVLDVALVLQYRSDGGLDVCS